MSEPWVAYVVVGASVTMLSILALSLAVLAKKASVNH